LEDIVKRFAGTMVLSVALLFAASLALSGSAFAQYGYDDGYYGRGGSEQAHQYGYQNGYHDGYRKGQHEGRENDPGDINVRALQEATHGYRRWMGPVEAFRDGYRDGYRRGFRMGYQATNRGWRDRDYDEPYGY
jgi:flagellar biosynthesis/type III secretory pathway protein FliH